MPPKQMAMNLKESQSVQSLNFDKIRKIDSQCEMGLHLIICMKKWLALSALISLLESPNHFKGSREKNYYLVIALCPSH